MNNSTNTIDRRSLSSTRYHDPPHDCSKCPRLVKFRLQNRACFPSYHNAPVAAFGNLDASVKLLIVGLAPGLKGANQTGRPFTGDYAGDVLYYTLIKFGFAKGEYKKSKTDGLSLIGCRITNAVRCVPPQNKPVGEEIRNCSENLRLEIMSLKELKCILALGVISHNAVLAVFGKKRSQFPFGHCVKHNLSNNIILADSYHCSRYNINTGRLTPKMFCDVFETILDIVT